MNTKLSEKEELICKIKKLSASNLRIVEEFVAKMEAEHTIQECKKNNLNEQNR